MRQKIIVIEPTHLLNVIHIGRIHVVNTSLNVSLNDDHQMLIYQSLDL